MSSSSLSNCEITTCKTFEDFLNFRKTDLQAHLRSIGEKTTGSKVTLAERAFTAKQCCTVQEHRGQVSVDSDSDFPPISELTSGWTSDLRSLPKLTHKDVESYLIDSTHRTVDHLKMNCYRQYIRGFSFFKEKYVHKIMINPIEESSKYCYVRSKCFPSMKQGTYDQWILLTKDLPTVVCKAYCTCAAGLGEGCTHVAGLLFAVEAANSTADGDVPCTSKPCEWNEPSKRKRVSTCIDNIKFKKMRFGCETHTSAKKYTYDVPKEGDNFLRTICAKLGSSNAVLFDLLPKVDQTENDVKSDINVGNVEEVVTTDYIIYESDRFIDLRGTVLDEAVDNETKFDKLVSDIPTSTIHEVETRTKGQSDNELWVKARKCRITSSNFHDILTRKESTNPTVLINKFTGESSETCIQTVSMKWGRKNESIAKKKYIAYMKLKNREHVSVSDCGIHLSEKKCYLGASPDGLIHSKGKQSLLEIKCPFKWRNSTVRDACKDKSFYCCIDDQGNLQLKKSHRYYTQVQGQMAICKYSSCEFVIYTRVDMQVICVNFDQAFWSTLEDKLHVFYRQHILPLMLRKN